MKEGWSFCIVTAPGNESILIDCMNKIHADFSGSENYEIIVVGNPVFKQTKLLKKTQIIAFKEAVFHPNVSRSTIFSALKSFSILPFFYKTGAISHKKNLAAKHANYTKLCIMHDYVGIEPGWKKGFDTFGNRWDVSMTKVLNKDGVRHRDWMAWDHPSLINAEYPISPCLIPYDRYTKYMYISGAYFCVTTSFFLDNPLDENLFWGAGEDVEWSLRVRELTQFKMNENSTVKYLKLKASNDAPNCKSWIENKNKMEVILNKSEKSTF